MKKPVVDMGECILCEVCVDVAPKVFHLNDLGFIEVRPLEDYCKCDVQEAVNNCPKGCIDWEDS